MEKKMTKEELLAKIADKAACYVARAHALGRSENDRQHELEDLIRQYQEM